MQVLITGANGLLGKKITKIFKEKKVDVIPTDRLQRNSAWPLDVTNKNGVNETIEKFQPNAVIHTAAITNVDWCELHPVETFNVNVGGTQNIVAACKKNNAKLVFISTDYIFDGTKKGKYFEEDKPNPLNVYSDSKLQAEKIIQKELDDFLILRVTVLYGYNDKTDKKCFATNVIESLRQGKEFYCFADQYSNPTLINDIAEGIFALLGKNKKGVFNFTGSQNIDRFEFAKIIAKTFGLDQTLLKKGVWKNSGLLAKRPLVLDIDISKAKKAGVKMSDAKKGLLRMKKDMQKDKSFFLSKIH